MITDGENSVLAVKEEWRIPSKWFIQLYGTLSLLREYAWLEIQFPIVVFILETDYDQNDTSMFFTWCLKSDRADFIRKITKYYLSPFSWTNAVLVT